MLKKTLTIVAFVFSFIVNGQFFELPEDIRNHNLTEINQGLLNPADSFGSDNPSVSLWSRWQWQSVDGDPSSLFFNYNQQINSSSAFSVGYFQHNTGVYLHKGAVLNYAYNFDFGSGINLTAGLNVIGFNKTVADERLIGNTGNGLPTLEEANDFVFLLAPGLNLQVNNFNVGIASENVYDYNFATDDANATATSRTYLGIISYDLLLNNTSNMMLKPSIYMKSIPNRDTQFGVRTHLSTNKYWGQIGYNSFYGVSGGIGGHFFKKLSIGVLVEKGLSDNVKDEDLTFEFVTAYNFGKKKQLVEKKDDREEIIKQIDTAKVSVKPQLTRKEKRLIAKREKAIQKKEKDSLKLVQESTALATLNDTNNVIVEDKIKLSRKERRAIAKQEKIRLEKEKDSIELAEKQIMFAAIAKKKREEKEKEAQRLALIEKQKQDSIQLANIKLAEKQKLLQQELEEDSKPRKGERYRESYSETIAPGYYLIANIYSTKKYYDLFMSNLQKRGLTPGSFVWGKQKHKHVYLERYDTMREIRKARDSKYNGKYEGYTWIFRIKKKE